MKLFFLALLFSLALAGLASANRNAKDESCADGPRGGRICGECAGTRQGGGLECRPRRP